MDIFTRSFSRLFLAAVMLISGVASGQNPTGGPNNSSDMLVAAPNKFVIIAITPASPTAGQPFDVTVQAQDASNNPANVGATTIFYFETNGNAGDLDGNMSGWIETGTHTVTIEGVILPNQGTGVTISTVNIGGDPLADTTSAPFNVVGPANHLTFVNFPSNGSMGTPVSQFTVEARRADNSVDASYTGNVTLTKASGPGTLGGTLSVSLVNGVATFNNVTFSATGSYTLNAALSPLTGATSGSINIALAPVAIAAWNFSALAGGSGNFGTSPLTANTADSHLAVGGLTRGAGVAQSGTGASNAWGGTGWNQTSLANAISSNTLASFTLTPHTGYQLSLDNIAAYNVSKTATGPTTGQWQYSINGGSFTNIGSAITWGTNTTPAGNAQSAISLSGISALQNLAPGTVVTFRVVNYGASDAAGAWYLNDPSDTVANDFIVNGNVLCVSPSLYSVTGGGTYCSSNPSGVAIGLSGSQVGISYQLKRNGTNVDSPVAGTGSAISFLNQSVAGTYTVQALNNASGCGLSLTMTGSVSVSVSPAPVAGSISGGGVTVCSGTNSTNLTLSGHTGTIQWQSSSDGTNFTDIPSQTGTTYTATNLTSATYYRAVLSSGSCTPVNTSNVMINVSPASVAGSISGGNVAVCTGTNNTMLTLSGHTGTIQWQSSPDNNAFSDISGQTGTTYTATNLTSTTYYRAVVTSSPCSSATTTSVMITVNPASVAGNITGAGTVCTGTNNTVLTLNGNTGTIQWQSSSDDNTFNDIPGETGQTYTASNLTSTTYYRAVATSSPCSSAMTPSVAVNVSNAAVAGSISGGGLYCGGGTVMLTLSGNNGTIQWQSSADDENFSDIDGETGSSYSPNVGGTMYYRVVVTNGACNAASASVSVGGGLSTTWNGSAWSNGDPDSNKEVIFAGDYTASDDLNACTITVNSGAVIIPSGFDVNVNGALTVSGGSFTLENNANLLQVTDAANSGNIIVKRNSSPIRRQDYTLWSSPVSGQTLLSFSPLTVVTPTSRFYQYNSETNLYNGIDTPGSVDFADAKGYLIRVANNHPAFPWIWNGQFSGVPHNGDYEYTLYNNGEGKRYNLVGNPYPSPISMNAFVTANNSQITGALYFWRETNGNINNNPYCIWSKLNGGTFVGNGEAAVVNPQGVIQTGQGFFVEASETGSSLSFTNAMRLGNNTNQFFRPASIAASPETGSGMWLNVIHASGAFCQTAIAYAEEATNGYDPGLDARTIVNAATQIYTLVDGQKLGIQGRALPFEVTDVVPLAFKVDTAGEVSIAIDHVEGLFAGGQTIYLKDNATGAHHNLSAGSYDFISEAGIFENRFEIVYQSALGVHGPTLDGSLAIVKSNGSFTVDSGASTMDNIKVFDIRGRLLLEVENIHETRTTFSAGDANQVLIVKVRSEDGQIATRKIVN